MAIITLTTDLGHRDFYLAVLKGTILSELPDVQILDISNQIKPFNIAQAAFVLGNSYRFFPRKTVHLAGVDCSYNQNPRFLAMAWEGHYFVGPDNGLFPLMMQSEAQKLVEITVLESSGPAHFPVRDILARAACHLAAGGTLDALGAIAPAMTIRTLLQPARDFDSIRGTVIYIDEFENAISNISLALFNETGQNRQFQITFRKSERITRVHSNYSDVAEGEMVCLFGYSGYLEIAMNKSTAAKLLGLKLNEVIQIDFFN